MRRRVLPELLDELAPDDPRAVRSRGDLRRVNKLMGNADIMARALGGKRVTVPFSILELGGGDGTFLLELAKRLAPVLGPARAVLVDQQSLVSPTTRNALDALSWQVHAVKADAFEWLQQRGPDPADITIANLFLHHFEGERLATLLRDASRQTRTFAACEPRRSGAALAAASLMGVIGCNSVTVHDARISVRAGFRDHELSSIWPGGNGWALDERKAGRFTHCFVARREERRV
jgi:hypothetical protein